MSSGHRSGRLEGGYDSRGSSPWGQQQTTMPRDKMYYENRVRESLQESIKTAAETNEIAQSAAEQLDQQSEHLKGIEENVDRISHNLDTSQYLIKGMKSWWGSFVQMFTSPPVRKGGEGGAESDTAASPLPPMKADAMRDVASQSASNAAVTIGLSESEKEMNEGLTALSGMLTEMHSRAVEMGSSIGQQNTRLDSINKKVDTNQQRMSKQKKDMDALLGR